MSSVSAGSEKYFLLKCSDCTSSAGDTSQICKAAVKVGVVSCGHRRNTAENEGTEKGSGKCKAAVKVKVI